MANNKQSDFTTVTELSSNAYIPAFTTTENEKITRDNFFEQIRESVSPKFIYKTIAQLQGANLEADEDNPTYVRCEETEYRLYKITSLAPGVDDISLTNGATATYQIEYRDNGFVIGPGTSTTGAIALFADATGENLSVGATPSAPGNSIIAISSVSQKSYPRINVDDTATAITVAQLQTDLSLPGDTVSELALKSPLASPAFTGNPTAPTPLANDNDTSIATTAFVRSQTIATFADLAATPAQVGQVVYVVSHTSGGVGGGEFRAVSAVHTASDGWSHSNSATAGVRFEKIIDNDLTLEDFGALSSAANNASAIALALGAEKRVIIPEKTFNCTATVTTDKSINLVGKGVNSVIDFSGGGKLEIKKALVALPDLASNPTAGDRILVFSSAHGLAVNDVAIIYNPTDFSFSPHRDYYRDGVMLKIAEIVSSTQVKVYGIIPSAFVAATVECYKINESNVVLKDFSIIPYSVNDIQIEVDGYSGVSVNNVYCPNGSNDANISIARSWNVSIDASGSVAAGDAYPIVLANCQHGKITGDYNSIRHCISFGSFDGAGCVPCRDFVVYNMTMENESTLGIGAGDTHGNCENIRFVNCTMKSGMNIGGKNIYLDECTIYGRPPSVSADGNCIFGSEFVGGNLQLSNCKFFSWGSLASFGLIYFDMNELTENVIFKIDNCTFDSKSASVSGAAIIYLNLGDSSPSAYRVDTHIDGFWIRTANLPAAILSYVGANDQSAKMSLIMDNIRANNGISLVGASTAANLNCSMRLPRSINSVLASIDNTSFQHIAAAQTFRYVYPRLPKVLVSCGTKNSDGSAQSGSIAGKTVVAFARVISTSQITMAVTSGDSLNFTSSDTVTLTSIAEINEL